MVRSLSKIMGTLSGKIKTSSQLKEKENRKKKEKKPSK